MRAFVEPLTYCDRLATAWLVRVWHGDGDPAARWASKDPHDAVCVITRERIDSVALWGLVGTIDMRAARDIRRAMKLSGIRHGDWTRARHYH